jgi:hypothetical protein
MHRGLPSVSSVLADSSARAGSINSSTTSSAGSSVYEHVWAKSYLMLCMMEGAVWYMKQEQPIHFTHKAFLHIYP